MGFHRFYETWFDQLHHLTHELSKSPKPPSTSHDDDDDFLHQHNLQLVDKIMSHYSEYYRVKAIAAAQDVLSIFSAPWSSSLERSVHWIAGWRPTTAFHLVYTESSIKFEAHIMDILRGIRTGDLGDLSPAQFSRVSELQCETVREENSITDQLSEWQEGAGDLIGGCPDIEAKIEQLVRIVERADELRLRTLKDVVALLNPQQALEFLNAAAQLQFGIRTWGSDHDRQRQNV